MISIAGFRNNGDLDSAWRFLIGFGCVPAVIALYFRFTIPETPRFTMDIARNVTQATHDVETYLQHGRFIEDPDATIERVQAPKASPRDFFGYFSRAENWKLLLALSYSWFALDVSDVDRVQVVVFRLTSDSNLVRILCTHPEFFDHPPGHSFRESCFQCSRYPFSIRLSDENCRRKSHSNSRRIVPRVHRVYSFH